MYKPRILRENEQYPSQHMAEGWSHFNVALGFPVQRGRVELKRDVSWAETACELVTLPPFSFYPDKEVHVQITTNHWNSTKRNFVHEATVSWVENVNYQNFRVGYSWITRQKWFNISYFGFFVDFVWQQFLFRFTFSTGPHVHHNFFVSWRFVQLLQEEMTVARKNLRLSTGWLTKELQMEVWQEILVFQNGGLERSA